MSTTVVTHTRTTISPELAQYWLKTTNRSNRVLDKKRVEIYASDMLSNRWEYNGDPIRFSTDGVLLDGQHRLAAIVKSGKAVECAVIKGLRREIQRTIDVGKTRTVADTLTLEKVPNAPIVAAAAALLLGYKKYGLPYNTLAGRSKSETVQEALQNEDLRVAAGVASLYQKKLRGLVSPGEIAFVYYLASRDADPVKAETFFVLLSEGLGLTAGHPVYQVRERLINNLKSKAKLPSIHRLALVLKAWQAFKLGREVKQLRWNEGEEFPYITEKVATLESR